MDFRRNMSYSNVAVTQKQYSLPKQRYNAQVNNASNIQQQNTPNRIPPPRPIQPKPPVPMEIDSSIQTAKANYINRPHPVVRQSNESSNIPRKYQRVFNVETLDNDIEDEEDELEEQNLNFYENEINFMTEASLEPPI